MTQANLKAVYGEHNANWRIMYFPGGYWELQEFNKLPDGTDRSRNQDWPATVVCHTTTQSLRCVVKT